MSVSTNTNTDTGTTVCAMNAGIGDINNDKHLDTYITNGFNGNVLFQKNGNQTFTDMTNSSGTAFNQVSSSSDPFQGQTT